MIALLVPIDQPFTIRMLRAFFQGIPADPDEAARMDGCTRFHTVSRATMPMMRPGMIPVGLVSLLLACNDPVVTSLLLDQSNMTMLPAISGAVKG